MFEPIRRYRRALIGSVSSLSLSLAAAPAIYAQDASVDDDDRGIEEVIVTASRRSESAQDVALTVKALGEEQLDNFGVENFQDYIDLLPSVSGAGQAPGKKEIIIRGVSPGRTAVRVAAVTFEPSVALYLDETPISTGGRNIDLFAADLNRVEVLKGPQGTLFGASSQAGTVRLIPNKPDLTETKFGGDVSFSSTRNGETSRSVQAYANIPVVEDKFALRVVGYSSNEGGFVDNVESSRQLALTNPGLNPGLAAAFGAANLPLTRSDDEVLSRVNTLVSQALGTGNFVGLTGDAFARGSELNTALAGALGFNPDVFIPGSRATASNALVAEEDFNDASYDGFRISGLWQIDDDWSLYVQHVSQTLDTEGIFEFEPEISDGSDFAVQTFLPSEGDDDVSLTTWTVEGRVANLDIIYNGSYSDRLFEGQTDYTGYADAGPFIPYYICAPGYDSCGVPTLFTDEFFETERVTQELRVSTPKENSFRFIGGIFYDDVSTVERIDFIYPASAEVGFIPSIPIPNSFATDPTQRPIGTTFFNDFQRDREEISFFGEIEYDLLDNLTATFGLRYYNIEQDFRGQQRFGTRFPGFFPGNDTNANLAGETPATIDDVIFKGGLSWKPSEDSLIYATYSEGFRAGGFNRSGGQGNGEVTVPFTFDTDTVRNYELGWKTQWLDNSLRFNGALFYVEYDDIQQGVLDFSITNSAFFTNIGAAEVQGLELETEWLATENLTLFAAATFVDSELTDLPPTVVASAPVGSELAFAPSFSGNAGFRYAEEFGDYVGFLQGSVQYTGERFNSLIEAPAAAVSSLIGDENRFVLPDYAEVDLSVGVQAANWTFTVFVDNLNNSSALLDATAFDGILRGIPIRPRTIGARLSFDY